MDRSSPHDGSSPSDSICHHEDLTSFRLLGNARQTMAEPLRIDQHARVCHRTQPRQTAKTGRHRWVVFRLCDGVVAVDAASCVVAPRLRPLSLSLGYRRHRGICGAQCHFIWCHLLHFHCHRRDGFRKLPVSNPCRPHFPPYPALPPTRTSFNFCCRPWYYFFRLFPNFWDLLVL